MSIEVVTLGCRLNTVESEMIRQHAVAAGLDHAIIINTCAVTAEAERQARQTIRRMKREHPTMRMIVTGCSAQIHPDMYAGMEEVDAVLGNKEKLGAAAYRNLLEMAGERVQVNDIMQVRDVAAHLVSGFDGQTRAFVQVQNGCDHRCTFCIIPYGRGNSRSAPIGDIVRQVRHLVEQGYREVVLTGVDVSAYGQDLPGQPTLGQMMRRLLALVPELPRLRLSSIDAVEIDADLFRLLAEEPRLMPHLHLSVQAGDDMVLKRMKRRHLRADILKLCADIRAVRPDVAFGADLIAGFPTETDDMAANSEALIDEAGLTYLHVFPYSARQGTPAARMPQVPLALRKERAAKLRAAGQRQLAAFYASQVGRELSVLVETQGMGHAENFSEVRVEGVVGSIVQARIDRVEAGKLVGAVPHKALAA